MVSITIDSDLVRQLESADGEVELRDADGRLVGRFRSLRPQTVPAHVLEQFDIEEIYRRERSGKPTYSTAEVLEHLRSLDAE